MKRISLTLITFLNVLSLLAIAETEKGLLPEIQLSTNEAENERKAVNSELMITRSENKAIESLQSFIKKQKGSQNEANLWYRLGELYMRRSKSGRFFDLHRDGSSQKLSSFPIPNEQGIESIKRAVKIYSKITLEFPNFDQMDAVYFNNAFANQQAGNIQQAQTIYSQLIEKYSHSVFIPDATLALGELLYDQGKFAAALEHFKKLEKYTDNRVYSYGMYKAAWSYYNMHETEQAIKKLVSVVKTNSNKNEAAKHNLRQEAIRDLTLFVAEVITADKVFSFFEGITTEEELGPAIINTAKLYDSHGRQKEMNVFLPEFIAKKAFSAEIVEAHLALIDANETLKERTVVLNHLQEAANLCKKDSTWRALQKTETTTTSCSENFHRLSLEMTKKWWEIWNNNKQNPTFSNLTQNLFKIMLDNEDPGNPDLKTRFAYAELLFQNERYDEASIEYKKVADQSTSTKLKTQEVGLAHDAAYAALFSKEKSIEKQKTPLKEAERKELALNYLQKNPFGKYQNDVKFKLGHIAYEENNFDESEKYLKPLLVLKTADMVELKRKSEDLLLDIYNQKKDYAAIKNLAKSIIQNTTDASRKNGLTIIVEESQFAEIQDLTKNDQKEMAAVKLMEFSEEHKDSKLAKEALWQSLGIYFSIGRIFEAAELSSKYADTYPEDKRNIDSLKDSANSYTQTGQIALAAMTLSKLAKLDPKNQTKHLEAAADLYFINRNITEARTTYNKILEIIPASDGGSRERIFSKLYDSYKNEQKAAEFIKLKEKLQSLNIEPYATQNIIDKSKELLSSGKDTAAFDLSMKANGRNVPAEIRAEARIIQAQILEKELTHQSVKANESKFALVLSIKTEKLDKAQTAYVSALKMSKDPAQQLKILEGLDRCYGNYIDSLKNMPMPASLSATEQGQLQTEILKIVAPIEQKKTDNRIKTESVKNSLPQLKTTERSFAGFKPEQTITPLVQYPPAEKLAVFLPLDQTNSRYEKLPHKECNQSLISSFNPASKEKSINYFEIAASCYNNHQYDLLEKLGQELAKASQTRSLGLIYASISAEATGAQYKALWLTETALKQDEKNPLSLYQKARLTYTTEGLTSALPLFEKLQKMTMSLTEGKAFAGLNAFSERDYVRALENFNALTIEQLYNLNVGIIASESYAQKGEIDKALKMTEELIAMNSQRKNTVNDNGNIQSQVEVKKYLVNLLLQQAHLQETYKNKPELARQSYEKALLASSQMDLRDWLNKKIEFLKYQNKVGQHVISGDL